MSEQCFDAAACRAPELGTEIARLQAENAALRKALEGVLDEVAELLSSPAHLQMIVRMGGIDREALEEGTGPKCFKTARAALNRGEG